MKCWRFLSSRKAEFGDFHGSLPLPAQQAASLRAAGPWSNGTAGKSLQLLDAPPSFLPTESLEPEVGMGDPRTCRGVKQNLNFLSSLDTCARAGQSIPHLL